jgi:hypothetical protein
LVEHVAANAGGDCRSYHRALLSTAEPTWVLCNPYVPAIAFARSVQDPADITYVDDDELARAFEAVSMVQVLTVFDLDCELSRADTSALEPGELRQVAYWQPATVGALLFNFWD